jgi:hypothetical protein
MLSHPSLRFSLLALLALLSGCAIWHAYEPAVTLRAGQSLPYQMRATQADSSQVELTAPFVRSDSLYGRVRGDTVGLALADIMALERSRFSVPRTAAVVVGVPLVAFGVTYIVLCEIGSCEAQTDILQ